MHDIAYLFLFFFINRFEPYVFQPGLMPPNASYEETTLFHLMNIGTMVAAFVFAPNPPYSRNIISNRMQHIYFLHLTSYFNLTKNYFPQLGIFVVWSVYASVIILCLMFITDEGFVWWMNFKSPPHAEYTFTILALGLAGGMVCYCWEVKIQCSVNCEMKFTSL